MKLSEIKKVDRAKALALVREVGSVVRYPSQKEALRQVYAFLFALEEPKPKAKAPRKPRKPKVAQA